MIHRKSFVLLLSLLPSFFGFVCVLGQEQTSQTSLANPKSNDDMAGEGPVRRYDWFVNLWNQKRKQWAERVQQDTGAIVFFGDSITQGWGDDFQGKFPGMKLANRGISGDTTRGMLYRLDADVLSLKPKGIVMLMGTNDLEEKAEPSMVRNNVELMIKRINESNPKMPIVLCLVFPASEQKARPASKIKAINELLTKLSSQFDNVTLVDTWTVFANEQGDAKPEEFPDLLHPNEAGYAKWRKALSASFQKLGWE
ncbi:MAG: SGNH/GDSL hydrolase family protein [Pirellula sp.]|jgi:lysophospholipase L1-like esterase